MTLKNRKAMNQKQDAVQKSEPNQVERRGIKLLMRILTQQKICSKQFLKKAIHSQLMRIMVSLKFICYSIDHKSQTNLIIDDQLVHKVKNSVANHLASKFKAGSLNDKRKDDDETYLPNQPEARVSRNSQDDKGEWIKFVYVGNRKVYLTQLSMGIFPLNGSIRYPLIKLVEWKRFDQFIIFLIILNSIFLGMIDYTGKDPNAIGNLVNYYSEPIFATLFTIEACFKIVAFGFFFDRRCYLRDAWNWLDFIVVITAILNFLPNMQNVSGLRTFRLFRPLRSLSALPNMRILVNTLLSSIVQLGHILILAIFFFGIFAIFGINLWAGALSYRCRQTLTPINGDWLTVQNDFRVCGSGHTCKIACGSLFNYNSTVLYNVTDFHRDSIIAELNWGITNFDHIHDALLTIFQCSTLQGWTKIMDIIADYYGSVVTSIYFSLCILICYYFVLNLTVAVMLDNFISYQNTDQKMLQEYEKIYQEKISDIDTKRKQLKVSFKRGKALHQNHTWRKIKDFIRIELIYQKAEVPKTKYYRYKITMAAYKIFFSYRIYVTFFRLLAMANIVVLALDSYPAQYMFYEYYENHICLAFNILFALDLILKFIAQSPRGFMRDMFNIFDTLVIISSFTLFGIQSHAGNAISALRAFRLLRIFQIIKEWDSLKLLIDSIINTIAAIGNFTILLALFIYVCALLGMSFFANTLKFNDQGVHDLINGKVPRENFDTLLWSIVTIFSILVGDNWQEVMYNCIRATGWYAELFFISIILFGNIIMLNLFLAIMLGIFQETSLLKREIKMIMSQKSIHNGPKIKVMLDSPEKQRDIQHQVSDLINRELFDDQLVRVTRLDSNPRKSHTIKDQDKIHKVNLFEQETIQEDDELESQERNHHLSPLKISPLKLQQAQPASSRNDSLMNESSYDSSFTENEDSLNDDYFRRQSTILQKSVKSSIGSENIIANQIKFHQSSHEEEKKSKSDTVSLGIDEYDKLAIPAGQLLPILKPIKSRIAKRRSSSLKPKDVFGKVPNQQHQHMKLEHTRQVHTMDTQRNLLTTMRDELPQQANRLDPNKTETYMIRVTQEISCSQSIWNFMRKSSLFILHKKSWLRILLLKLVLPKKSKSYSIIDPKKMSMSENFATYKKRFMHGYEDYIMSEGEDDPIFQNEFGNTIDKRSELDEFAKSGVPLQVPLQHQVTHFSKTNNGENYNSFENKSPVAGERGQSDYLSSEADKIWKKTNKAIQQKRICCACIRNTSSFKVFENFILTLILVSSVLLILDNPLNDPDANTSVIIRYLDASFTFLFLLEALIKILAFGFITTSLRNVHAYLRSGWNILDLVVVTTSLLDFVMSQAAVQKLSQGSSLKALKALRAIRALRPLRVISRNEGLKLVVDSLLLSLKALSNLMLVLLLFILIFAIIGINLFKGTFYSCRFPYLKEQAEQLRMSEIINDKFQCLNSGGFWVNKNENFDNISFAILTLFELMITEGWQSIMYAGVDSRGIDLQPKRDSGAYWVFYFIFFVIIGNFFILNIFVAVVMDNFNKMKQKMSGFGFMTDQQKQWVELQRYMIRQKLIFKNDLPQTTITKLFYNLVNHKFFEMFITFIIVCNTITMAMRYYQMPNNFSTALDIVNYIFAAIFNLEMFLKVVGLGCYYFRQYWNIFDMVVVVFTDIGIIITLVKIDVDVATIATIVRAFRIVRIVRLMKSSKNIKVLLNTLVFILPTLANIGSLILLVQYIYAILGVNLFSTVMFQEQISETINFTGFGNAYILLIRCTTGEYWNTLMNEYANTDGYNGRTCIDQQSYQSIQDIGLQGCGNKIAYFYFCSYQIVMAMIIMNLFIAAVVEGFSSSNYENSGVVTSEHYQMLLEKWSDFDKAATGWISPKDLAFLIYDLDRPLGKKNEYEQLLNNKIEKLRNNSKQMTYKDSKEKYFLHLEKDMILPQSAILKTLRELALPLYDNYQVHFKDVCQKLTSDAIRKNLGDENADFDVISEKYEQRIEQEWIRQHSSLKSVVKLPIDTGMHWAGLFIYKMIKKVRERKLNKELMRRKKQGLPPPTSNRPPPAPISNHSRNNSSKLSGDSRNKSDNSRKRLKYERKIAIAKQKDTERSTWWQTSSTRMEQWLKKQEQRQKRKINTGAAIVVQQVIQPPPIDNAQSEQLRVFFPKRYEEAYGTNTIMMVDDVNNEEREDQKAIEVDKLENYQRNM